MLFRVSSITAWAATHTIDKVFIEVKVPLEQFIGKRNYGASVTGFLAVVSCLPPSMMLGIKRPGGVTRYLPKDQVIDVIRPLDYDLFTNAPFPQQVSMVSELILTMVRESNTMRIKPKEFDKDRLATDVESVLREHGWIS
jgi:hypothetical protein